MNSISIFTYQDSQQILLLIFCLLINTVAVSATNHSVNISPVDSLKEVLIPEGKKKRTKSADPFSLGGKRKADRLYENFGYMASADLYQRLANKGKLDNQQLERLADSYRLNGETEDAEFWYAQIINSTDNPDSYLHYAQVLQSNDKCEDATRWYQKYRQSVGDDARSFPLTCADVATIKENTGVQLTALKELNSGELDYSAVPYADGLVFTSTRSTAEQIRRQDKWTQSSFSDLYFSKKTTDGSYTKPESLRGKINRKYHDGVATFNQSQSLMIFSRNDQRGRNKQGIIDLKLYSAQNPQNFWVDSRENPIALQLDEPLDGEESYWVDMGELNINDAEFSSCHPTLSKDGRRLYFASNRPGGYGGMDIWLAEQLDGEWQTPINLGPTINSAGNEIFPFIANDEKLYYASDGHLGVGGLDIFVGQKANDSDERNWSIRENLGTPFNSPDDDFSFTTDETNTHGYLTSNRAGGKGQDDLYEWEADALNLAEDRFNQRICVFDEATGDRISDAMITIQPMNGDVISQEDLTLALTPSNNKNNEYVLSIKNPQAAQTATLTTNERGLTRHRIQPNQKYQINIDKKGYHFQRSIVTSTELLANREYCLPLSPKNCLLLKGRVESEDYHKPIAQATVKLLDRCRGGYQEVISDSDGQFEFCVECDCAYQILASKNYFTDGSAEVSTAIEDCANQKELTTTVLLKATDLNVNPNVIVDGVPPQNIGTPAINSEEVTDPNYPNGYPAPENWTPEMFRRYFLGRTETPFTTGQTFTLRNIYYDFDKYHIRTDASDELEYLVALLNTYPSMEIAMTSHTDSRGSDRYNRWLSNRRAQSARRYLVERGIESYRIHSAKGLGEYQLVNHCNDAVECDEVEHQENRRTEIRIVQMQSNQG
ncbi:MAG: OmpA family protein [Saprospiraceae bacterium]